MEGKNIKPEQAIERPSESIREPSGALEGIGSDLRQPSKSKGHQV